MKFIPQLDQMDCGPACVAMILNNYGKRYSLKYLRETSFIARNGVSLLSINEVLINLGFKTKTLKLEIQELIFIQKYEDLKFPCILHWNQKHFLILKKISRNYFTNKYYFHLIDPEFGYIKLEQSKFEKSWLYDNNKGIVLFANPTEKFYKVNHHKEKRPSFKYIFTYLKPYYKQFILMFILLLFSSTITLILPFLTQKVIDQGIKYKDFNLIYLIFFSQVFLSSSFIFTEIIRNRTMLYVGSKLSINIISDFLKKIFKLPIRFFESKMLGDFNQRIYDNERIEKFLTSQSLLAFFSIISFSAFFIALWYFNPKILLVYIILTLLSVLWSVFLLKKRKMLDYFKFQEKVKSQESINEMIMGITEMKLNQFENFKQKEWENIQNKLFKINLRILRVDQLQVSGFEFLNILKNIIVSFMSSVLVIQGDMTLGELLAVSYILGQMNSPINQLILFFKSLQDAKLSIERLNEVQINPTEDNSNQVNLTCDKSIILDNVSFQYEGPKSSYILKNINLFVPKGKITAIVGSSGSGKTTLIKLLLKLYLPTDGNIMYNNININQISSKSIREISGVVMQDGFIFSDTIERNIAAGDKNIDYKKLEKALDISNINNFISSLPLGLKTKIGASGNGLSGGQKQRILIARAVYKNPSYIFFDEATSALDSENEKIIYNKLQQFFKGKTVVIIAHRLSTVKNANQIAVLKNGQIVEIGDHKSLIYLKKEYYNLIENQLELGN